jgi:DNA-binding IclR family transcriptional regulator
MENKRYFVPAVEKAFAILELFASDNQGYALSDVSRMLKLPVSTTKSLLNTMVRCGYLKRDGGRHYSLTMKIITEASRALNQIEIRQVAHEELKQLTQATSLACALSVRDGDHLVYIEKIEGAGHIMPVYYAGKSLPLHCTATGKALLAYLPDEQVDAIVTSAGLPAYTDHTITILQLLKRELERVRTQGYSIDNEEVALGLVGIAAPVFDHSAKAVAAVGAGGTTAEVHQNMQAIITHVKSTALQVSKKLGYKDTLVTRAYRPRERKTMLRS